MDTEGKLILPDTYNHRLTCGNCSFSVGLKIPIGTTIQKYAFDHECTNCGCKILPQNAMPYSYSTSLPTIYLPLGLRG